MSEIPIIFENDEIFVINKPSGMSVQGGEGVAHPLDEELSKQVGFKVHLVHRLDKETTGLMVVAKSASAAAKWISLIASKQVQKEYTAVCFGEPLINGRKQKSGTILGALTRKSGKNVREQSAVTHFEVIETREIAVAALARASSEREPPAPPETVSPPAQAFSFSVSADSESEVPLTFSKIRLRLGTGRMHQIRIHLASVGSPICGDDKHGNFKLNKLAKKRLGIKNLLLCSQKITIPLAGERTRTFEIPLPDYFGVCGLL